MTQPTPLPPMEQLDGLDEVGFAAALAPLFEGAPRFVARLAARRPYGSYRALLDDAGSVARSMPDDEQIELIDSHPRIGAPRRSLSQLSFREQGHERDAPITGDEDRRIGDALARLNAAYESRFGFRFVVFVAGRSRAEIVPLIEECLGATREAEKERAIGDVIAIAEDRVRRLRPEGRNEEDG